MDMKQVKHPDHYAKGRKYEAWDVAKDWDLDLDLGSVLKYLSRCGRKAGESKVKDLYKCIEYIQHTIDYEEAKEKEQEPKRPFEKPELKKVNDIRSVFLDNMDNVMRSIIEKEMFSVKPIMVKVPEELSTEEFIKFLKEHNEVKVL